MESTHGLFYHLPRHHLIVKSEQHPCDHFWQLVNNINNLYQLFKNSFYYQDVMGSTHSLLYYLPRHHLIVKFEQHPCDHYRQLVNNINNLYQLFKNLFYYLCVMQSDHILDCFSRSDSSAF